MSHSPQVRWLALGLSAAVLAGALSACAPLLVGGAVLGTVKVTSDRRTAETQLVDEAIELRAGNRLREALANRGRVNPTSYGRRVLLLGEVPTAADKALAERTVATVDNVLKVINELSVMPVASLGQRSEDVGITARVRGQMLNAKDLNSNAFTITTHLGVVYILGIVTEQEAARAVELARNTQGVKRVVNMVDVISQSDRPAQ